MSSKPDSVNMNTVALSADTIAVRDATDTKCEWSREWIRSSNAHRWFFDSAVLFFDINGKALGDGKPVSHAVNRFLLSRVSLRETPPLSFSLLLSTKSFILLSIKLACPMNVNWPLQISFKIYSSWMFVRRPPTNDRTINALEKSVWLNLQIHQLRHLCFLGTNIGSFRWNDKNSMLAGIADGKLNIWLYPNVVFVDQNLLDKTIYRIESRYKYFVYADQIRTRCSFRRLQWFWEESVHLRFSQLSNHDS